MPRKCAVPSEVIIDALRRNIDSLKDSEGNIFGPTFEIWKNIAEKLGTSSKNVYQIPGYTSNVRRLFVSEKIMGSSRFETK